MSHDRILTLFIDASLPAKLQTMGIHVTPSTSKVLDLLVDIDSGVAKKPRTIERVMKALGLKQPSDG